MIRALIAEMTNGPWKCGRREKEWRNSYGSGMRFPINTNGI